MLYQNPKEAAYLLNSWKEIAEYLGRGVRTVQRWERELKLPVHRGNGARSPVYANIAELKFWMNTSEVGRQQGQRNGGRPNLGLLKTPGSKPIENSRRLLLEARELAKKIAETSVRQRREAENLYVRILQMRTRSR